MSSKIVVVGGGFAGFWAALAAKRVAGTRATIAVVSRQPVLEIRPRLYEAAPETLGVDIVPLLQRASVDFITAEVERLDHAAAAIELASGERLTYDRLVIATGSRLRRPDIPGVQLAFSIDTQSEAIRFDRRLAQIARDVAHPRIAVIGAGFTGIELGLELRDRVAAHRDAALGERLEIVLIDREHEVGAALGAGPRAVIEQALAAARIELRLGVRVTRIAPEEITFDDGSSSRVHAAVLTTGMVAAPFADRIPGERDALGRVVVDEYLRAPALPRVFVVGDAAAADTGGGRRTLQSCQHALQLGRFGGENAARDLLGLPLVPYRQPRYVTCLDLGRSGAIFTEGWKREIRRSGVDAKALKQQINRTVIYPPAEAPGETLLGLSSVVPSEQGARPATEVRP